ncbi:MAG: maleylpyruvate isomerase family mycothiol-dependent enzyme [Actinobacteria bacterium]|jgi:uncharacterized protein (TIGR03083 family)|nr:maleylpyruvate isomerase family mycothiol-dependent enzyme [Actinomycetota bacterium]
MSNPSTDTARYLEALHASVNRLHGLVDGFGDDELTQPAFPSEWTVADVLSHLGSGAVITTRRLEDAIAGADTPEDFAPSVWDEWNSKAPAQQRRDALTADARLMEALDAVSDQDRDRVTFAMGPMTLTFADYVAMRLNEHAFHTWDIEVVHDPAAVLPPTSAEVVVDHLELVARFTAQPTGEQRAVRVATTEPDRSFVIELGPEAPELRPVDMHDGTVDLELPADAFARLVYGRLDVPHTGPTVRDDKILDVLRHVFPGP